MLFHNVKVELILEGDKVGVMFVTESVEQAEKLLPHVQIGYKEMLDPCIFLDSED